MRGRKPLRREPPHTPTVSCCARCFPGRSRGREDSCSHRLPASALPLKHHRTVEVLFLSRKKVEALQVPTRMHAITTIHNFCIVASYQREFEDQGSDVSLRRTEAHFRIEANGFVSSQRDILRHPLGFSILRS